MTNDERMTKPLFRPSCFDILSSFVIRHSSLLIFGLQKAVIERGLGAAKRDEQGGIELSGVGFQDESLGLHVSQAGFVDKLGAQGIIDISNRDNSRRQRNGVAGQSVGIA